ncbi:hypothetical protein BDZ94DRAFT_1311913 [Collybia nuda]|uniref:Uncharacterized protein n=1 Tax=Collybia nuda TaxID=64659 RepID=A0A9P5Y096_9AGAR|nr:hypothetical protein BDZ94DRAFT_1311913 [Collybia nuda]
MLARLSQILSPFPGILYTPENTYQISPYLVTGELDESELWFSSKMRGVFREGLGLFKPIVRGGGSQGGVSASGDSASHSQGQGNHTSDKGKDKGCGISEGNNEEDGFEDNQANSGGGGSGEGSSSGPTDSRSDHEPKILSIPFHSNLVIKGEKQEVLSQFTTSATVNMKLTENTLDKRMKGPSIDSNPYPDGWFGPWFSIQIPFIQTDSSDAVSDNVRYNMSMAQVRVVASSSLSSFLSFSPLNSHNVEDPVKAKSERSYTGGGWATLSGAPSLKIGGSASQITGQETSQRKWGIVVSPSSDTKTKKSIIWKYALNDRYYDPQPTATFQPGPTVNFGHKLYARRPHIEVELVVYWSVTPDSTRSRLRQLFSGYRSKECPQPPNAFTNLLHQVSVSVDLESLDVNAWVVGLNPDLPDEESLPNFQGSRQFEPIRVNADSDRSTLKCEVTLQRALYGCIQLVQK